MACCTEHRPGTLRTWAQDIERPTCSNGCSRPACPQPVEVGLQPVRWRHATVGFTGAGVGGRGAIALQHDAGLPAGDAHEVDLTAALGEPRVREGVPELVRTQPIDPRLLAAAANQLVEAELRQRALLAEPEVFGRGVRVLGADAKVAVERDRRLPPERQCPLPSTLAEYRCDVEVEV